MINTFLIDYINPNFRLFILRISIEFDSKSIEANFDEVPANSVDNCSSLFYFEHSNCELEDLRSKQQAWLEAKFREKKEEESHLFIEQKFDSFFRDFNVNPEPRQIENLSKSFECSEETRNFTREDIKQDKKWKEKDDYSVWTDKGSEGFGHKDNKNENEEKKFSNFWKRIDMRQKKVIRGLCGLTRDYFKSLISNKKSKQEMFSLWDESIKRMFPDLYLNFRFQLLGQISVMCLSWKFPEKIREWKLFTPKEMEQIINHGTEFRDQRNKCSSSKIRKIMLSSHVVQIGKFLYFQDNKYEELFWNQILERKKSDIINFSQFKEIHLNDINKIKNINVACSI